MKIEIDFNELPQLYKNILIEAQFNKKEPDVFVLNLLKELYSNKKKYILRLKNITGHPVNSVAVIRSIIKCDFTVAKRFIDYFKHSSFIPKTLLKNITKEQLDETIKIMKDSKSEFEYEITCITDLLEKK